jgi:lipopolysaccharide exporter
LAANVRALMRRKFVRDTLVLQAGKIFNVGISFVASVIVARLMQPTAYGEWALTASFFGIWQTLNITGLTPSTISRLSAAVGAGDSAEILNLMAFYVRIAAMWAITCFTLIAIFGTPLAERMYSQEIIVLSPTWMQVVFTAPEATIGQMAALYSLVLFPDSLYALAMISLQSRRLMRLSTIMANVNQVMLTICVLGALLISPNLTGMIAGRLAYSFSTMLVALWLYAHQRDAQGVVFPTIREIVTRRVPLRPYFRFGFFISLDRSIASLFVQITMQSVGIYAGTTAAGYLQLAMKAMQLPNTLTSAIFDNMQAVVPQAVGRRDFRWLWRNFNRVLLTLTVGAVGFYGVVIVFALTLGPAIVPLLYGSEWTPAVPLLAVLAVYGAVTTIGGIFGPLYRALELVGRAAIVKIIALVLSVLPGLWLVHELGAMGGAWMISLVYTLSAALTAVITLPVLRQRAQEETVVHDAEEAPA